MLASPNWNRSPVFLWFSWSWYFWRVLARYFVRISLNLVYCVFSWLGWNYVFLARIFQKWCALSASYQGVHDIKELHWWLLLWYLVKVIYTKLIDYRFTIFPLLINKHLVWRYFETCFSLYYRLLVLGSIDESYLEKVLLFY